MSKKNSMKCQIRTLCEMLRRNNFRTFVKGKRVNVADNSGQSIEAIDCVGGNKYYVAGASETHTLGTIIQALTV